MHEAVKPPLYREMGLSEDEYKTILRELGREPTLTELGMFGVLWSEHCSYKSSKPILKFFKNYQRASEMGVLENAGVVDIGDGIGIAFKVESHNHPSAVEPFQGAATGVGGIIRDVLSMGARPIACLDSLRFGDITRPENNLDRRLFDQVVQGIGNYGNCIGVPTVAGEVHFHPKYSGSPVVNAMCIGLVPLDKIASSIAKGVGNSIVYLGSATGRDGIHGATFASEVLGEDSEEKRPSVQIGDPFAGKLLVEATLEALATGAIVSLQDMGAAGLTCSTCEMSARGGVGMEIDLDKVPLRDSTMNPYEIMLSESQERMLAVVEKGREDEVIGIFRKWSLPAVVIGEVTNTKRVVVKKNGKVEADIPADFIVNGCPTVFLDADEPEIVQKATRWSPSSLPEPASYEKVLLALLSSPNIAAKNWVFEQYDTSVQTRTTLGPGKGDAAVLFLRENSKGIVAKIDGNGVWTNANPYVGGQLALLEAARNVACAGGMPLAATDCLNFGNPNDPKVYYQFREAVRGIADASEKLKIPIVSGNVSFYNETQDGAILPTPTVGVVGVLENAKKRVPIGFPNGIGYVYIAGCYGRSARQEGLGASEYLRVVHGIEDGSPEPPDLEGELGLIRFLVHAIEQELFVCAHDISEGGVAVALAEMCCLGEAGCFALIDPQEHFQRHILAPLLERMARGKLAPDDTIQRAILDSEMQFNPWTYSERRDAHLFGELSGRALFGISAEGFRNGNLEKVFDLASEFGIFVHCLGTYDSSRSSLQIVAPSQSLLEVELEKLRETYFNAIPEIMERGQSQIGFKL